MSRSISLVQRVEIASPCSAKWDEMSGDDRVRFCAHCKLNVYNLSAMTEADGERLIIEKEGKLCARIYRRADGTIITRDCPVGLAELNRRVRRVALRAAAAVAVIAGAVMTAIQGSNARSDDPAFGWFNEKPSAYSRTLEVLQRWVEATAPPRFIAGDMAVPYPPPQSAQSGAGSADAGATGTTNN